jgi:hypothetical protein
MEGYTANDMFEDCISGTSQPSPAGGHSQAGQPTQQPLQPLPTRRQQLEAPPSGAGSIAMAAKGGRPKAVKPVGPAEGGRARRALAQVDANQRMQGRS